MKYGGQDDQQIPQTSDHGMTLEQIVIELADSSFQFQQETQAQLQGMADHVAQLAKSVLKLKSPLEPPTVYTTKVALLEEFYPFTDDDIDHSLPFTEQTVEVKYELEFHLKEP